MTSERKQVAARSERPRRARLWKVLVVAGMALATACPSNQNGGSGSSKGSPSGTGKEGGGAGGW